MSEGIEIEEHLDICDDNYVEELDDEIEDQLDDRKEIGNSVHCGRGSESLDSWQCNNVQSSYTDEMNPGHKSKEGTDIDINAEIHEEEEKYKELLALPPHGSEVFIGGLPRDVAEDKLRELCAPIGEIHEVQLAKNKDTGEKKGFAFITFRSKHAAKLATEELHNREFEGRTLRCSFSETKNRLFIGNLPKSMSEDEFRKAIDAAGPGAEVIELIKDPSNPTRNRGFAFVLYYNKACAEFSRQRMSSSNFKIDGVTPSVSWADPKGTIDQSSASYTQVKTLFIRNLPQTVNTEQLKDIFGCHGRITKVVIPTGKDGKRDFGFIYFAERASVLKAIKDTEKYEIDGHVLEVAPSKSHPDKKSESRHSPHSFHTLAGAYGTLGSGFSGYANSEKPVVFGGAQVPAGMCMVPMMLPDGRIGYVLQQAGAPVQHARERGESRDYRARSSRDYGRSRRREREQDEGRHRRYRPY